MDALVDLLLTHTWWRYQPQAGGAWLPYHLFNLFEGAAWLTLGGLVAWRWLRQRKSPLELAYAGAFIAFGLTDFREAFVLQSWLILLKGILLAALLKLRAVVLRKHYPGQRLY